MTVIELDARRRLSFGKIGRKQDTRYIVDEQPDGTLVLTGGVACASAFLPSGEVRWGIIRYKTKKTRFTERVKKKEIF